jgi:hypothetical protein
VFVVSVFQPMSPSPCSQKGSCKCFLCSTWGAPWLPSPTHPKISGVWVTQFPCLFKDLFLVGHFSNRVRVRGHHVYRVTPHRQRLWHTSHFWFFDNGLRVLCSYEGSETWWHVCACRVEVYFWLESSTVNVFNVKLQHNPSFLCVDYRAPTQSVFSFSFEYTV